MNRRMPAWLRHATYNLRGGFLVRPLTIALALGIAGMLLSWIEEEFPWTSGWVPRILFPSHSDPQVAQVILAGIAASIMTVVSIVFAILLMTLTLASMQFSPRIIVSFSRDRVTQWTLGVFLGTFSYCMAALPAARSAPQPFAPVMTVLGAMLLAIICVGWLLFFIHHITEGISVSHIVDRIATETIAVIDDFMPVDRADGPVFSSAAETPNLEEAPILSQTSGYIRFVDTARLVDVAKSCQVTLRVVRRVGQFIPAGAPLLTASKISCLDEEKKSDLRDAFDLGPSRTLQQDVEFGILQIVDIALKAISPAVNDPTTAITSIDQLSRILIHFLSKQPPSSLLFDPPGVLRVHVPWAGFPHLLNSAFEQIRMYSLSDVAVSLRMLRALGDIASTTEDSGERFLVAAQARRTVEGCGAHLGPEEMKPLRARLAELEF